MTNTPTLAAEQLLKTIYEYADELGLNIVAKRHNGFNDRPPQWDCRVSHPWFHQPLLSSCSKSSFEECEKELNERAHVIENMRVGIERKNKEREEHAKRRDKEERCPGSQWFEDFT